MTTRDVCRVVFSPSALIEWADDHSDPAEAWSRCPRADWMLLIAGRLPVDRRVLVTAAGACVRLVQAYATDHSRTAVDVALRWAQDGGASVQELEAARAASWVAFGSVLVGAGWSPRASSAAEAAACATISAAASCGDDHFFADFAAQAVRYAVDAEYFAHGGEAARVYSCHAADLVRSTIPWKVVEAALEKRQQERSALRP